MTGGPVALILAEPNGAGKTTASSVFVGPNVEFVNADIVGAELRAADPSRVGGDVTAGRIVSARLRSLAAEKKSFCFETNLASPGCGSDRWLAGRRV
jgi:predicted ABC-type ATPase